MMIQLQVPEGDKCEGCMFLDIDMMHSHAKCNLFQLDVLDYRMDFGQVDIKSIKKADSCPRSKDG